MKKSALAAAVLLAMSPSLRSSPLSDLAARLGPGSWAELKTNNIDAALGARGSSGFIFGYAEELKWDPRSHRLFYVGGDHGDLVRFVSYTESTNGWDVPPRPSWLPEGTNHGYDHLALDGARGFFYARAGYTARGFWRLDTAADSWSPLPDNEVLEYPSCCGGVEFFPEMDGLVLAQGNETADGGGVFVYREVTNRWERLARGLPMGIYNNFLEYSPTQKVVVFGGGNNHPRSIYRMDKAGGIAALHPAPIDLGIQSTVFTHDPSSGDFLVFAAGNVFYTFHALTDTWTARNVTTPFTSVTQMHGIVAAPINTHGVVLFVKPESGNFRVYIYKHAAGGADPSDTTAPTAPDHLMGTPASSSQINLSWSGSTDNVAVAAYHVYRDSVCVGTAVGCSWQDTQLAASTNYSYHVTAFDAAGNESGKSPVARAATLASEVSPPVDSDPDADEDFEARCAAPGVVRFFSFDSASKTDPCIDPPWGSTVKKAKIVTDVKASGAGSLRFEIPAICGPDTSGSFHLNFSDDLSLQFGEGEEFYVQWRQRFSPEFLDTPYAGGGGWKQAIIGEGDRPGAPAYSCTQLEVVVNNQYYRGFPQMYHSCGQKDGQYEPLVVPINHPDSGADWLLQNAVDCRLSLVSSAGDKSKYIPPCVGYKAHQWMTFQVRIKIGTWYKNDGVYHKDSVVQLWIAEERQPSKLVIDFSAFDLANTRAEARYGKIWFTPYNTGKSDAREYPVAHTWYDELIISRNRIADPAEPVDTLAPAPPRNLRAR